jgi:DNA polymerase-1
LSILLVDALNLFTRHFVANPAMSDHGYHVGGIVGFLNSIRIMNEKFSPNRVIVVWESGGSPRRRALLPSYKSNRRPQKLNRYYNDEIPDTVQGRDNQISVIVEILKKTPVSQLYVPDCEADDVIGYISKYCYPDEKKIILSSDKDFYQLLDEDVDIYSPTRKRKVTAQDVASEYNISASNFCLAKSFCGDVSDNIPGVKGVGFKVFAKRFPSVSQGDSVEIESIFKKCRTEVDQGTKIKLYHNILGSRKDIERNWKIIYLDIRNLSHYQIKRITDSIDTFEPKRDKIAVMRTLIREGTKTLDVDRLFLSFNSIK